MSQRSRPSLGLVLVLAMALAPFLAASGARAAAPNGAGFTFIFSGNVAAIEAQHPYLLYRLASSFTQGLADFLFEVNVMRRHPERLDPALQAQLKYPATPGAYANRFLHYVQEALVQKATEINAELKDTPLTVVAYFVPTSLPLVGGKNAGIDIDVGELVNLLVPDAELDKLVAAEGGDIARDLVHRLVHSHIFVLNSEMSQAQLQDIQGAFREDALAFESRVGEPSDLYGSVQLLQGVFTLHLGDLDTRKNMVTVDFIGETKKRTEPVPPSAQTSSNAGFGLSATPRTIRLAGGGAFRVEYERWLDPALAANQWVTAYFGKLNHETMAIDQGGLANLVYEYMPEISLKLAQGNAALRFFGNALGPTVHLKTLSFNLRTLAVDPAYSHVNIEVLGLVNVGQQQKVIDTFDQAIDQKMAVISELMHAPAIAHLMTEAAGHLIYQ